MFAEELSGNASRKRQEEARARRKQIKQQQERRSADPRPSTFAAVKSETRTNETTTPAPVPSSAAQLEDAATPELSGTVSSVTTATATKPSAVANALQQRQLRQEQQLRQKSALTIQSFYRAYRSKMLLLQQQASLLTQRLNDLNTLRTLIHQKTSTEYIPPPATATALVRQLLFITKSLPRKRMVPTRTIVRTAEHAIQLRHVLETVVIPGTLGNDENLDTLLAWCSSKDGQARLTELLRLCFVVMTGRSVTKQVLTTIDTFLRTVLGTSATRTAHSVIVQECRQILPIAPSSALKIDVTDHKESRKIMIPPFAFSRSSLDLILILRHHLLFSNGDPIPKDASMLRDSCFSGNERSQNDFLFQLSLDAIQSAGAGSERRRLQTRFVTDILTVPLLTWRLSATSVSKLLTVDTSSGSCRSLSSTQPNVMIMMLTSLIEQHAATVSAGKIASILPTLDVPLTACPAINTQCLLANLVQIGRICPSINGSDLQKLDYQASALFFNFLSTLIDVVPLGTFSSRESAVEWISDGKSHHTPIVLSPVVLDQCKLLLADSYVRELFTSSIDNEALGTEDVLRLKNEKDLKHEKNMAEAGTSSAAALAAKEARVDRSTSFWQSSKWARKLSMGVSKMLTGDTGNDNGKSSQDKGQGMLVNTSSISRKLAHGKGPHDRNVTNAVLANNEIAGSSKNLAMARASYSPEFFFSLCRVYGTILARWGGGGKDEIVKRNITEEGRSIDETKNRRADAAAAADACTLSLLNVICFSTSIVRTTWAVIQSDTNVISDIYSIIDAEKRTIPIRSLVMHPNYSGSIGQNTDKGNVGGVLLYLFVCCFSHILIITDDIEIHDMDKPIPIHHVRRCIQLLKKLLYRACCIDDANPNASGKLQNSDYFGISLITASSRAMRDLYDRSSRRPLCVPKLWLVEDLLENDLRRCKTAVQYESLLSTPVLRICPFLVSFKRRLRLFERIVTTNRIEIQGSMDQNPFSPTLKPGIPVRIMRGRVLEDGLSTLNHLGRNMRQRISVQYLNEAGARESGIDVGGLFKEFWTDLSAIAFNPNYALFRVTEGAGNCLYPNPASGAAHGSDHIVLFEFLGRILGKALFEGITIHPQFAHFFLSFLRGDYNFLHMLPDLSTMDPQLYNNLMFLKTYDGDAEDLCLTFSVANDDFGGNKEIPLISNGQDIPVTNLNKQRYIGLMAKHHVCDRLKEQSEAFTRGLWEVIDRSWLRIFNEPELQVLISGSSDGKIDVADMRSNARYVGGYTGIDRHVNRFWNVVASFNSKQQADLLRFVTSCERPPPLGFGSMNPPFTIQRVGILRDSDKLPTASTCFNTLKLPTYSSEKVLRQRLLYAIESGAGFELT